MDKIKLTIKNGDKAYGFTVPDDFVIDEANLNKHIANQPGLYSWQAVIAVRAAADRDAVAQAYKDKQAEIELKIRADIAKNAEKSTEDKIRALVATHAVVQAFRQKLTEAEQNSAEAAVLKEAMYQKNLMLTALAANVRRELENQKSSA